MGLGDITDEAEKETKNEQVDSLADELGIEDKDDLEEMDGRLDRILSIVLSLDKKVEDIEDEIEVVKSKLDNEDKDDNTSSWKTS